MNCLRLSGRGTQLTKEGMVMEELYRWLIEYGWRPQGYKEGKPTIVYHSVDQEKCYVNIPVSIAFYLEFEKLFNSGKDDD